MFKRTVLALSLVASSFLVTVADPAEAADWSAPMKLVVLCTDTWFEVELAGKTMAYGGIQKPIRFMVKASVVGTEKFKQMYAMSLTAFTTQAPVWLGTKEPLATTSTAGGNCGTNNVPAQTAMSMSIYR